MAASRKRRVHSYVTPFGEPVAYAADHIILRDLRGQQERGRFAEAAFFAAKLRADAAELERYFLGEGGAAGPALAYSAQRYLDRLLSALDFCLGARSARNELKDNRDFRSKPAPKKAKRKRVAA